MVVVNDLIIFEKLMCYFQGGSNWIKVTKEEMEHHIKNENILVDRWSDGVLYYVKNGINERIDLAFEHKNGKYYIRR